MKSLQDVLKSEKKLSKTEVLDLMKRQSAKAQEYWKEQYEVAARDVKWIDGEQETIRSETRVRLILNKLRQFVSRVVGDQRQNVHTINIIPTSGDLAGKEIPNTNSSKRYSYADVMQGLIRQIEYTSSASQHYKQAFKQAVMGGIGFLRVYYTYAREDSFDMDIKIESIPVIDSVLIDPTARMPDYSDINYAFIFTKMDKEEFTKRYPNADLTEVSDDTGLWEDEEKVTVAEYFRRVPYKEKMLLLSTGEVVKESEVREVLDELYAQGIKVVKERDVILYKVQWYLVTANDILEETTFPGDTIPVIPVLGREILVDKKRKYRSLVYDAIDGQKMHNVWFSSATEKVSLSPIAPWVGPHEVFEGYESIWKNANVEPYSYLPYNNKEGLPAPQKTPPAPIPSAELQLALYSVDEIKSSIGMYDASLGQISNETSGRAILARQRQSDTGTFEFLDNLDMAIMRVGKILVSLIPKVYDTQRVIRIRFPDGTGDFVEINKTIIDRDTGDKVRVYDLSAGKYDVVVETGASYNTRRAEAADKLLNLSKLIPQVGQVAPDIIVQNLDFPNSQELAKRLRKTIPPELVGEEDAANPQAIQQQEAQQQAIQQAQMLEQQKQQLELQKEQLDVEKQKLETEREQIRLEIERTKLRKEVQDVDNTQSMPYNGDMKEFIREQVAQAIAEYIKQTGGNNE